MMREKRERKRNWVLARVEEREEVRYILVQKLRTKKMGAEGHVEYNNWRER